MFREENEVSQAGITGAWRNLLYAAGETSTKTCVRFSLSSEEVVRLKGFERRNNMTVPSLYAVDIAAMSCQTTCRIKDLAKRLLIPGPGYQVPLLEYPP